MLSDTLPEDAIPLPLALDQITAAWLTQALSVRYPGVEVTGLEIGTVIWGTATKVRLLLEYNASGQALGLPPTMMLKAGLDDALRAIGGFAYTNEVRFYREMAPELDASVVNVPACHFAAADESVNQGVLLLEDLAERNVTFRTAHQPISVDTAAAVLDMQASYHARWWGDPLLDKLGDWNSADQPMAAFLFTPEHWTRSMALPRAEHVPDSLRDRTRVTNAVNSLWAGDDAGSGCLLHGDTHLANLFFEPDGKPGFLDWQGMTKGHWASDVADFLVSAIEVEDRRAHERALLAHYVDRLAAYGAPAPSFDEAWKGYRQHLVHGFLWVLCPPEMQPEDICTANTLRFTAAMLDHDVLGAFE